ncbi:MAG: hypothetical protein IKX40_03400 [Thermoguttaceae bacterium]|nr:hypothetical protein [Thermoguttaceae bacterium]
MKKPFCEHVAAVRQSEQEAAPVPGAGLVWFVVYPYSRAALDSTAGLFQGDYSLKALRRPAGGFSVDVADVRPAAAIMQRNRASAIRSIWFISSSTASAAEQTRRRFISTRAAPVPSVLSRAQPSDRRNGR